MMRRVILTILYILLGGVCALIAIEEKRKLLGFSAGCWFICAVLNLYLLARC